MRKYGQGYLKMWIYSFDPLKYINNFPGCCSHHITPGIPHGPTENTGTTSKAKGLLSGPDSIMYILMCLGPLQNREQFIALKHIAVRMMKFKSLDTNHAVNFMQKDFCIS